MANQLAPATPGGAPPPRRDDPSVGFWFTDPDSRVLLWSYAVSIGLAVAWLIVVHLFPVQPPELLPKEETSVTITLAPPPAETTPPVVTTPPAAPATANTGRRTAAPERAVTRRGPTNRLAGRRGPTGRPRPGAPGSRTETYSTGAISDAFGTGSGAGTGGLVGDVSGALRGVAVASGSGGSGGGAGGRGGGGAGGKTVLGYGQGGEGGRTPGRGGFGGGTGTGGGGGGGGIGGVGSGGGGGGITRAAVRVAAPRAVKADNLGGVSRDVGELGEFVRSRESQLRFCYVEFGLKQNPSLAGTINVAITLTGGGSVTGVDIRSRTWSGAGQVESCIRDKISGWKFPSSSAGGGTYTFPFNFTK